MKLDIGELPHTDSPINEMLALAKQRPTLTIKRGYRGYGFTLRAIKVYYDDTDFYTIQHFVIEIDQQGPAYLAGLRKNDIITHVNDEVVCGRMHHEIVKLILSSVGWIFIKIKEKALAKLLNFILMIITGDY